MMPTILVLIGLAAIVGGMISADRQQHVAGLATPLVVAAGGFLVAVVGIIWALIGAVLQ